MTTSTHTTFLNSKISLQLFRVLGMLVGFVAFTMIVYVAVILGLDLPEWRMNGDTVRIYSYFSAGAIATIVGCYCIVMTEKASKALDAITEDDEI